MKTMKTSELTGKALDWAVAKAEGWEGWDWDSGESPSFNEQHGAYSFLLLEQFCPSSHWAIAGPIIEREGITIIRCDDTYAKDSEGFTTLQRIPVWCASTEQHGVEVSTEHQQHDAMYQIYEEEVTYGPTPLVAAMRAYAARKLGSAVEVPDELLDTTEENVKTYRGQGRGKDHAHQPPSAPVGAAEAWQEGYRQGVLDERASEDNIGIAGFDAKVEPARNNPYALAQQPAAVDGAMVERIAALLHEEATAEPWTVAGVEHEGPDRDYYRKLARKVLALAQHREESK